MKRIDRSNILIRFLERMSNYLARRRGLPIIVGVLLIAVGGILEFINLAANIPLLDALQIIFRTIGLVLAFVGILLMEPLGK